jgi:hypothetical protein
MDLMLGMVEMTTEQYDMLIECIYTSLTALHKSLKKDDFLDWPIQPEEMIVALVTISMQAGIMKPKANAAQPKKPMADPDAPSGELEAKNLPTGTSITTD